MLLSFISMPKGGGAESLVRELHKIFNSRGVASEVCYFSGSPVGLGGKEKVLGKSVRSPLNILKARRAIKDAISKSYGGVIVHAHLTWPFFYVALAGVGIKGVTWIYTEHNTTNKRRGIPLAWAFERLIYARYSRIICISEGVQLSLAKWVGKKLGNRLVTIPNGSKIYELKERPPLLDRKPRLISVGSLTKKQNFHTTITAVAKVKHEIESYCIIGEGPERAALESLIRENDLENTVKLIGWKDDVDRYFHEADIQLIPSLWEGFGLVAVEGMSTGLPVVASKVDGLQEVLGADNLATLTISDVSAPSAWAAGIHAMIELLHLYGAPKLALTSRSQAEKFTLDKMADSYITLYNSFL